MTGTVLIICLCLVVIGMILWNHSLRQTLARCELSNAVLQQKTQPLNEWKFGVRGTAFEQQDQNCMKEIKTVAGFLEGSCIKRGKLSQCVINMDPAQIKEQKKVRFDETQPFNQQAAPIKHSAPMAVQFGISSEKPAKSESGGKEAPSPAVPVDSASFERNMHMKSSGRNIDPIKTAKRVLDDAKDSEFKWANDD